jgi:GNAT superfamily N-acetyltransferase
VGVINGELACHIGLIQFPMRKGYKRVHRLVVLPDYQGIGVGTKFQDLIVEKYIKDGWNVNCTTTTPALVHAMKRNEKWALVRFGRVKNTLLKSLSKYYPASKRIDNGLGSSSNRVTYSFDYKTHK